MIRLTRFIFYFLPAFPYSICFGAIVKVACFHLEPSYLVWVAGKKYTWEMFTQEVKGEFGDGVGYTMPSARAMYLVMIGNCVFFALLAWYFDHVIPSNRGVAQPYYFLFTKKYWTSLFQS